MRTHGDDLIFGPDACRAVQILCGGECVAVLATRAALRAPGAARTLQVLRAGPVLKVAGRTGQTDTNRCPLAAHGAGALCGRCSCVLANGCPGSANARLTAPHGFGTTDVPQQSPPWPPQTSPSQ